MKIYLIILSFLLLPACTLQYDSLEYYVEDYAPNSENFSVKGYYYKASDSIHHANWPNAVKEMYFFENGTFNYGSNHENIDSLDARICRFGKRYFRYGPFGYYTIINDTILTEYIITDPMGDHKAERYYFKAIQIKEGIKIIELNGKRRDEDWAFHKNDCVPDSVQNWLTNHRKYKLKTCANKK